MGNTFSFTIMRNDRKDGTDYGKNNRKRACEKNGMAEILEEKQDANSLEEFYFKLLGGNKDE